MARQYQPRRFFRNAPNRLLQQYFSGRGVLAEVDFGTLTETQVEPIYEAWLKLPEDARNAMEQDFQEIDELACEGGSKAILDEARYQAKTWPSSSPGWMASTGTPSGPSWSTQNVGTGRWRCITRTRCPLPG